MQHLALKEGEEEMAITNTVSALQFDSRQNLRHSFRPKTGIIDKYKYK